MKSFLASLVIGVIAIMPVTSHGATFSQHTHYTEEVLSVVPYRIKYVLTGKTTHAPEDFPALALDGQSTLVYALADKDVMVYSDGLYVGSPTTYFWPYRSYVNTDPTNPISSITQGRAAGYALHFNSPNGSRFDLTSEFVVELKPSFTYDPAHVRVQAVYLTVRGAPYIDVFARAP